MEWEADGWYSSTFFAYGELLSETEAAASFLASHIAHPLTLNVALTFYIAMAVSHIYHSRYYCFLSCFQKLFKNWQWDCVHHSSAFNNSQSTPLSTRTFWIAMRRPVPLRWRLLLEKSKQRRSSTQGCCSLDVAKIFAKDNESLFGIIVQGICAQAINMHANETLWSGLSLLC